MAQHKLDELQALVLQIARHATRPLRLLEVADAISTPDFLGFGWDLNDCKEGIRRVCTPPLDLTPSETLIITDAGDGGDKATDVSQEDCQNFAMLCISYLASGPLDRIKLPTNKFNNVFVTGLLFQPNLEAELKSPFADYALENWVTHLKNISGPNLNASSELTKALDELMKGDNAAKLIHCQRLWSLYEFSRGEWPTTGLVLAVVLELTDYVRVVLERDGSNTALPVGLVSHAAKHGNESMVNSLLDHGADIQEIDITGLSPLHEAVRNGHCGVAACLLKRGAQPLAQSGKNRAITDFDSGLDPVSPLSIACHGPNVEMLSLLLEHVKSEDTANWALRWAVEGGNRDTIKRVLELPNVNVNAMGKRHWDMTTPLSSACSRRNLLAIELLLDAGADARILHDHPPSVGQRFRGAIPPRGDTALHQLSKAVYGYRIPEAEAKSVEGQERMAQCFRRLLDAGADVHQRNDDDATPLLLATDRAAVRALIEAGSDVNAWNFWGETVLHLGNAEVALAVLDIAGEKVDLNADPPPDRTVLKPLLSWIKTGSIPVVLRMLELSASVAVTDKEGNGVFHHIAMQSDLWPDSEQLISALLASGADINLANNAGQTALQFFVGSKAPTIYTSKRGHDVALAAILRAGADAEVRDVEGRTPLFHLAQAGDIDKRSMESISKTLIDAGADLDTRDQEGRSLLHAAAGRLNADSLEFLLQNGARVDAVDSHGNTIWHEAAKSCIDQHPRTSSECLKKMAGFGADAKRPNHAGRTPLHVLSATPPTGGNDAAQKVSEKISRFDILLHWYGKSVDVADVKGVTPLHLASEMCEHHVQRLLDRGADPTKVTDEGLSPLHLATRAGRENIVALLIHHIRSLHGDTFLSTFVNRKDAQGRSILWHACSRGQSGIADRLFSAGATTLTDSLERSCWEACIHYEAAWAEAIAVQESKRKAAWNSGDKTPAIPPLQDMVELLASRADKNFLDAAIEKAAESKCDYVVECLVNVHPSYVALGNVQESLQRRQDSLPKLEKLKQGRFFRLEDFWAKNDLSGIRSCLLETDLLSSEGSDRVHRLAAVGFASTLSGILTRDLVIQLEDRFEEHHRIKGLRKQWFCEYLLRTALKSEQPNMRMVKLLIEGLGEPRTSSVDIQANSGFASSVNNSVSGSWPEDILFLLIKAGHWWQIHEALPYLIRHGADLNVREKNYTLTPLHVAVDITAEVSLDNDPRVVRLLLDFGADPNALAGRHQYLDSTPISLARDNADLAKLLIARGAVPTPEDFRRVIERGNKRVLKVMLDHGADPNTRTPKETSPTSVSSRERNVRELFPLHLAYMKVFDDRSDGDKYLSIVELLLEHGADPLARYDEASTSIIHLLISRGINPSRLLDTPRFNIEERDGTGSTVFLAACKSPQPRPGRSRQQADSSSDTRPHPVTDLMDRGADIRARDNSGKNALHLLQHQSEATRRIIEEAPDLVHQQDNDGNTPLHLRIQPRTNIEINDLLEAGADVTLANKLGETPLHLIFGSNWQLNKDNSVEHDPCREATASLIQRGADVNARNEKNETPLFYLLKKGRVVKQYNRRQEPRAKDLNNLDDETDDEMEKYGPKDAKLFRHLADLGVDFCPGSNSEGTTLLHVVAGSSSSGNDLVGRFKFLLEKGHDPKAEDKMNKTALDVAVKAGNKQLLDLV